LEGKSTIQNFDAADGKFRSETSRQNDDQRRVTQVLYQQLRQRRAPHYNASSVKVKPLTDSDQNLPMPYDYGLAATLMPNRARTTGMRLVGWFLLIWGLIIGIHVANVIGFDLYTRTHWRTVEGNMLRYEEKSWQVSSRSRPSYWIEFEVEFDPKDAGCNTGMSWGIEKPFPCIGTVKSPGSQSRATAMSWIERHPPNSPAKFFYDPPTGRLRFAGESIAYIYPWGAMLGFVVGMGGGVWLLSVSRRRLQFLKTLPEYYGATPPDLRPDELTDLNLS